MLNRLLSCALISIVFSACVQKDIKQFVADERVDIKTISPDSTDFSELQAIGKAIGDSRVVMMGEQDHGDSPAFLAKTRLVKYLHEEKGFNVLAFESDFFALNEGWDRLEKQKSKIDPFLSDNIFSIWSKCNSCDDLLYNYVPKTYRDKNPLIISGFDNQITGSYSDTNLKTFIDNYLKGKKINYTNTEKYQVDFLSFIDSITYNKNLQKQRKFKAALQQISHELSAADPTSFETMLLKSLMALTESEISFLSKKSDDSEIRDNQMAENLKWLLKYKFPKEKIIVWAHNAHIIKHPELIKNSKWHNSKETKIMGNLFTADKQLNEQTYILGFNSRVGSYGRTYTDKKFTVELPAKNSFETWIPETVPYTFVNFKQFREENPDNKKPFLMKGVYHFTESASWTDIYDGIFYIREMYPCASVVK
ncbi:Erythromycin esterase [compost metagenome]|uniref:erythromycin esterase family protein n=1 Tax=Pedobacter ghigonis TaxID=2730403 RepID=UPI000F95B801|nr:erythromycin esterase family protein [Pedobacter ghigonis]